MLANFLKKNFAKPYIKPRITGKIPLPVTFPVIWPVYPSFKLCYLVIATSYRTGVIFPSNCNVGRQYFYPIFYSGNGTFNRDGTQIIKGIWIIRFYFVEYGGLGFRICFFVWAILGCPLSPCHKSPPGVFPRSVLLCPTLFTPNPNFKKTKLNTHTNNFWNKQPKLKQSHP